MQWKFEHLCLFRDLTVQANRINLRNSIGVDTTKQKELQAYAGYAIGVLVGIGLIVGCIYGALKFFKADLESIKNFFPAYTFDLGFYLMITLIFTFVGFIVGAAVMSA
jgi:uncharacterized membrane protein